MAGRGRPKTGGRQKGTQNKQTAAVQAAAEEMLEELGADAFEGDGYGLLALVYKNKKLPLSVRLAAAGQAMPYERPRLSHQARLKIERMRDELIRRFKNAGVPPERDLDQAKLVLTGRRCSPTLTPQKLPKNGIWAIH